MYAKGEIILFTIWLFTIYFSIYRVFDLSSLRVFEFLLQFSKHAGELIVDGVARLVGGKMSADGAAYEGHIAEDVEEFVASGLVLPLERTHLEESEMRGVAMLYTETVGQAIKIGLGHDAIVDDKSVGEVAAADKPHLHEGCNLANEDEGASGGEIGREATEIVEIGALRRDEFAIVEVNGRLYREICRRRSRLIRCNVGSFNAQPTTTLGIAIFHGLCDGEVVAGLILFEKTYAANLLDEESATAIQYGELGAIDMNQAVVDAASEEGGHSVLNGRDAYVMVFGESNNRAARSVYDIFGKSGDDWFTWEVNALHLKTMACRSGEECGREVKTCMKTLAAKGEGS